jgi:hypothetical protein
MNSAGTEERTHQHGEAHTAEENIRRFKNTNKTIKQR